MRTALEVVRMIQEDCMADSTKRVEFTQLGVGTIYGELLAMIDALARVVEDHLQKETEK